MDNLQERIEIGKRIRERRLQLHLTQEYIGKTVSMNKSTIQRYENGEVQKIKLPVLQTIARALDVNPDWLALKTDIMGSYNGFDIFQYDNIRPMPKMKKVPRLGAIACGEPILANEEHGDFDSLPVEIKCDFTLICKGDSMINARIYDGDIVAIKSQPTVENGEIAAVIIDDEATLKRVYQIGDSLILQAENPNFKDLEYHGEQLDHIKILGKAVYFISNVR